MPGLLWMGGVCFWARKLAVWSSWGFQMSIRLSQGYLRLTEASRFVNLHFLTFGSSKKDDPCNKPSLWSSFVVSKLCVTSHNTFFPPCAKNSLGTRLSLKCTGPQQAVLTHPWDISASGLGQNMTRKGLKIFCWLLYTWNYVTWPQVTRSPAVSY